jgi:thiamine biosynthesis lipoprotein ApbE
VKIFRTHITKAYSFAVVLLGFVLHLAMPIQESKTHSEFTSWLDAKVKSEENAKVRSLIESLADDAEELETLIRKASEIVSENSDDFELPVSKDSDVFDVLIGEWNAYQNATSGMGKAVVVENIKSNAVSQKEVAPLKKASKSVLESCMNNLVTVEAGWQTFTDQSYSKPFLSGVAINAP